jgi:hypothetical protein
MQVLDALRGPVGSPFPGLLPLDRPGQGTGTDPVFVFSTARSGSTLTRFLLDAHPDLACPPETGLPEVCARLAKMLSLLAGGQTQDETMRVPDQVIAGTRHLAGQLIEPYLAQRGKRRYCEKTMEAAKHADLLLRVFPGAKFVCLYRHPMDVIASALEACPWGLKGLGPEFDSYSAGEPGNSIQALARYWADSTARTLAVEDKFRERCHRVRYEDLVTDPETTASRIFEFIGVPAAPGISSSCFTPDRQRFGPADYKIWNTSKISADSVGRGWAIPAYQIDSMVTARLNELADRLGYVRIERNWGAGPTLSDLRVPADGQVPGRQAAGPAETSQMPRALLRLGDLLQAGLFRVSDRFVRQWEPASAESFEVIATALESHGASLRWRVDLAARTVALTSMGPVDQSPNGGVTWQITGSTEVWDRVLGGKMNFGVMLRQRELRYCDTGEIKTVGQRRLAMFADLLGLASWRAADQAHPAPAA